MVPKQKKAPDTAIRGRPIRGRLKALTRLAGVAAGPRDPVFTLYRTLLAYGAVAILISPPAGQRFTYSGPFARRPGARVHLAACIGAAPRRDRPPGPHHR